MHYQGLKFSSWEALRAAAVQAQRQGVEIGQVGGRAETATRKAGRRKGGGGHMWVLRKKGGKGAYLEICKERKDLWWEKRD